MDLNEKYLDNLLKSMDQKEEPTEDHTEEITQSPSLEEVQDFSEDEILKLLESTDVQMPEKEAEADSALTMENDLADLAELDELLKNMEDENLSDIQELLYKSDNDEPVLPETEEIEPELTAFETEAETEEPKKSKKKKHSLFKKKKTEEAKEKEQKTEQKTDPFSTEPMPVEMGGEDTLEWDSITDLFSALEEVGTEAEVPSFSEPVAEEEAAIIAADVEQEQKEEQKKEQKSKEKKPGVLSKFFEFLFAEDDDFESQEGSEQGNASDVDGIGVELLAGTSEENKEVLAQLDKEDQEGKKKKKKKKGKKDDKEAAQDSEDDGEEGEEKKDNKKKKKKEKKEKKQKEPELIIDEKPTPKLSKKKVSATFFLSFTVMAAILVGCLFIPELFEMQSARKAYYAEDYETCYRTFYGKNLSESDERMFEQSRMLLAIQKRVEGYESFLAVGNDLYALDLLLQAVQQQEEVLLSAQEYNLTAEADAAYQEILQILADKYGLTEADAKEINAYEEDAIYTLRLKSIVEGTEFVMPEFAQPNKDTAFEEEPVSENMEDVLPAEEELTNASFEEG